jgi:parvulin-like peptidyl-prolyl isomerase
MRDAPDPRRSRLATGLLALGALIGVGLAALGILGEQTLAEGTLAIATVNGTPIPREAFEGSVARLAADKRNPLSGADRAHVLARMIEEELLIQRGVEIGLVESDRGVRAAIAASMIDAIVAEVASDEPDAVELRAFYAENERYFARPSRLRVQQIFFKRGEDGRRRAAAAHAALQAGGDFHEVRTALGDEDISGLPDASLPPAKLRDYLGPTLARAAAELSPGEISRPLASPSGLHILRLLEYEALVPRALEEVHEQVAAEYRRRAGDRALREYLDWLRRESDVALAPDAPR